MGDNTTKLATDAFVIANASNLAVANINCQTSVQCTTGVHTLSTSDNGTSWNVTGTTVTTIRLPANASLSAALSTLYYNGTNQTMTIDATTNSATYSIDGTTSSGNLTCLAAASGFAPAVRLSFDPVSAHYAITADGQCTAAGSTVTVVAPFTYSVIDPVYGAVACSDTTACSTGPDSTTAIAAAFTACAATGGIVTFPQGTFEASHLARPSNCTIKGAGMTGSPATPLTKLIQKANSNQDFIVSVGVGYGGSVITQTYAAAGVGSASPTVGGGWEDIWIDGNQDNQSGAGPYYGLREYAVAYHNRNLRVADTKGPCAAFDYNNSTNWDSAGSWNTTGDSVTTDHCGIDFSASITLANSNGVEFGGPADLVYTNFISYDVTGDAVFVGHNVGDAYVSGHCYSPTLSCVWNEGYGLKGFIYAEGSPSGQTNFGMLGAVANMEIHLLQATPGSTASGITFGQASGGTPHCHSFFQTVPGNCSGGSTTQSVTQGDNLRITSTGFTGTGKDMVFTGFQDGNVISITADHTAGSNAIYSGTPDISDMIIAGMPIGNTCVGTIQTCGGIKFAGNATALVTPATGITTFMNTPTGANLQSACSSCTQTVASGTSALGTGAIASTACATVVTTSATGVASTDTIQFTPNVSIKALTGYTPATTGGLTITPYPTANNVNFDVCNWSSGSITPSALTLNWKVTR
jgi:hypothetical protein